MDTLPNTPPERRLSILCDLDAIMLTISGEDDEVLVPPHLFSLGARRASEPNLLEPASSIFLTQDLPRRGSGCKSSLSMQRQLTPVGEEQANAVSTSPKKVDPSGVAETHSEEAVLTMSGKSVVAELRTYVVLNYHTSQTYTYILYLSRTMPIIPGGSMGKHLNRPEERNPL